MEIAAGDCGQEGESGGEKEASATPDHTEDEEEEEGEVSGSSGEPQADPEENPSAQLIPSGMADSANQTVASTLGAGETPSPLGGATSGPEGTGTGTMDSVQQIRDMMVEVIDVEELAQRFPDGVPQEEE
ncbi:hypothetical protein NHX12_033625 [Muraenolepis orangiensis]|uniref:Uncharacterized protein n=1 Tax=Muraenolepis orangiensis TaxID=630683 RepID=A0A9Q0E421_9TELE|nr:hypothetical protein NHX12_033625 [Muraenolepis orangiensis]